VPSFKERHPKFRKNTTPDYLKAAADQHQARVASRGQQASSEPQDFSMSRLRVESTEQKMDDGNESADNDDKEADGPIDMSIKKHRSESPPAPPSYRYTPLLGPPPAKLASAPTPELPHRPAPLFFPTAAPPPYAPPSLAAPARPPPPSYESATTLRSGAFPQTPSAFTLRGSAKDPEEEESKKAPPKEERAVITREITIITADSSADPLLDEHFRRSLGAANYENLFKKDKEDGGKKMDDKSDGDEPMDTKEEEEDETQERKVHGRDPIRAFKEDMEGYTGM